MITLEHTALFVLAMLQRYQVSEIPGQVSRSIPWLLLPDAIRAYIGPRQPSHFEIRDDWSDVSWMKFPMDWALKEMSKETAADMVEFHLADGIRPCVIGEETQIDVFDEMNYGHPFFHELRTHMLQDVILDMALRDNMVDVKGRYEDCFVIRHNTSVKLSGKELREQVKTFEEFGFLHLVGKFYQITGVLLNSDWFRQIVYPALLKVYPEDLADTTFRFMRIPDHIEKRINELKFDITSEDDAKVQIAKNLEEELDKMFSMAFVHTCREMSL